MPGAGGQASAAQIPWGWLGRAQVTTDSNGGTITSGLGVVDITGLSQAVTVGASRRVRVSVNILYALSTTAGSVTIYIREGSTTLQRIRMSTPANDEQQRTLFVELTPSAGAHTYKVSMATTAGSLRQLGDGSGEMVSGLLVEDIGPST